MRYFLIAGERSGDLHGSNLIRSILKLDTNASFFGIGGDQMENAGMEVFIHYREMAFMGIVEVLQNLRTIRKNLKLTENEILRLEPDVVILIDYGGFNMKLATRLQGKGIPIHYYISPKVWAWNQGRAWKLKRIVDRMFVILPFEKEFFKRFEWDVDYVGNPVLDAVKDHSFSTSGIEDLQVALLPGSRKQELKYMLPLMIQLAQAHPEWSFRLATVDNLDPGMYDEILSLENVQAFPGHTYDLLKQSRAAVVTSGTATLETALIKVPQVVIYRASPVTYAIGSRLVKTPFISLVNLIANKQVVIELLQDAMNLKNLDSELSRLMNDDAYRRTMISAYDSIHETLDVGRASDNAARLIYGYLIE